MSVSVKQQRFAVPEDKNLEQARARPCILHRRFLSSFAAARQERHSFLHEPLATRGSQRSKHELIESSALTGQVYVCV